MTLAHPGSDSGGFGWIHEWIEKHEYAGHLLDPDSAAMKKWDMWCALLLLYTAYMTPMEVAFMRTEVTSTLGIVVFTINRIVDLSFFLDIFRSFATIVVFSDRTRLTNPVQIALRYIRGWFVTDLLCIFSGIAETIGLVTDDHAFSKRKGFRLVRLLRLLKLAKTQALLGNALKRWQNEISVDFGLVSLFKMAAIILTMAHWACCGFRLVPDVAKGFDWYRQRVASPNTTETAAIAEAVSWMQEYKDVDGTSMADSHGTTQYLAAFYWAIMTLTTLGYGDVTITTNAERLYACLIIVLGGGIYAYVVGSIW